jgi:signal transduction histidine kinase
MALTFFDVGSSRISRWMVRYAAAVLVATAAFFLTRDIGPLFERAQFFLALSGVIVTVWYCGRGPAFTAIGLFVLGYWFLIVPPAYSLNIIDAFEVLPLLLFVGMGVLIALLVDSHQRRRRELMWKNDQLEREGEKRNRDQVEIQRLNAELEQRVCDRTKLLEEANETLGRQADSFLQTNIELERFAYACSHDLQEPLRTVSSYVRLIAKRYRGRLDSDADEFIRFAADGADRMQYLIRQLLVYSRQWAEDQDIQTVNSEEIFCNVLEDLQVLIADTHASVTHDPLPLIAAHSIQLKQLFQNLIENALKFCRTQTPRVHVAAVREDAYWVFFVCDNGIGIEPADANKIFTVFQRLHGPEEFPGAGIGLATCKRIVENLGGRIWVQSELGRGSTFFFALPLTQALGNPSTRCESLNSSGGQLPGH